MLATRLSPLVIAAIPFAAFAQQMTSDLVSLRSRAVAEGSVVVVVATRVVPDSRVSALSSATPVQQGAIDRTQQKIILRLASRGLLVGGEVSLQPDGFLVLRVLPEGLDVLARSAEVTQVRQSTVTQKTQP